MMLNRRELLAMIGIGVGGLVTGCGTSREPNYTVVIRNAAVFDPATLVVPVGSVVAWHNRADRVHTITADPAQAQLPARVILPPGVTPFDSGNVFAGERWVYRFETPGTYVYFCRYHELDEMLGAITVVA
ncbi:MAG: hypothetical protein H7Y11_04905 [Armatimonadetes bacterium]|nr:hypothetical protein [Anaerolineae bacterium]